MNTFIEFVIASVFKSTTFYISSSAPKIKLMFTGDKFKKSSFINSNCKTNST